MRAKKVFEFWFCYFKRHESELKESDKVGFLAELCLLGELARKDGAR